VPNIPLGAPIKGAPYAGNPTPSEAHGFAMGIGAAIGIGCLERVTPRICSGQCRDLQGGGGFSGHGRAIPAPLETQAGTGDTSDQGHVFARESHDRLGL